MQKKMVSSGCRVRCAADFSEATKLTGEGLYGYLPLAVR